jgi:hypothetical protein
MNTSHTLPEETALLIISLRENDEEEFYAYIKALTDAKWSLRAIAAGIGCSFTSIQKWKQMASQETKHPVPEVPQKVKAASSRPVKPEVNIPTADRKRILELTAKASMVRGRTPKDSPYRKAALELEDLLHFYKDQDVSYKTLAEIAQVSRRAIAQRLEKKTKKEETV